MPKTISEDPAIYGGSLRKEDARSLLTGKPKGTYLFYTQIPAQANESRALCVSYVGKNNAVEQVQFKYKLDPKPDGSYSLVGDDRKTFANSSESIIKQLNADKDVLQGKLNKPLPVKKRIIQESPVSSTSTVTAPNSGASPAVPTMSAATSTRGYLGARAPTSDSEQTATTTRQARPRAGAFIGGPVGGPPPRITTEQPMSASHLAPYQSLPPRHQAYIDDALIAKVKDVLSEHAVWLTDNTEATKALAKEMTIDLLDLVKLDFPGPENAAYIEEKKREMFPENTAATSGDASVEHTSVASRSTPSSNVYHALPVGPAPVDVRQYQAVPWPGVSQYQTIDHEQMQALLASTQTVSLASVNSTSVSASPPQRGFHASIVEELKAKQNQQKNADAQSKQGAAPSAPKDNTSTSDTLKGPRK